MDTDADTAIPDLSGIPLGQLPAAPSGLAAAIALYRGRLQWTAVHPVTGDSYRVASYYPLKQVVAARDWELVTDGDLILVVPRSMTLVPGGSHGS